MVFAAYRMIGPDQRAIVCTAPGLL
jgi:hypothetical protein